MGTVLDEKGKQAHLREMIADFDTAMLVTRAADGELRARPLALARSKEEGALHFPTSRTAPKIDEIAAEPRVSVTMQDKRRFVSISGRARVTQDRALIDALWSEAWKVWFPKGKDDPDLCLLTVTPTAAEYWDNTGGKGFAYLFEAAKAYVSGTVPAERDDEHNAKVRA